jgi:hypothetical protein
MVLAAASVGCGARQSGEWTRTMPSPDGCFVQVWNRTGFAGNSDFINGPRVYPHLRDLPGQRSWQDRIASLRLGPGVSAVAWSQEQFAGPSAVLTEDSLARGAFAVLPVHVQSLEIRCGTRVAQTR